MQYSEPHAVVVGAGAVGVSTAYHLADRGAAVTLLDRGYAAGETTGKAAGFVYSQLHYPADVRAMDYSFEFFRELAERDDFAFHETGFLRVGSEAERPVFERQTEMQRKAGADVRLLDADGIADIYPELDRSGITVGAYSPNDGHADPHAFTTALLDRAERLGVDYRPKTPVGDIRVSDGRVQSVTASGERIDADAVVVAAGPWSHRVGALAGVDLPLKPYRTQALVTTTVELDDEIGPVYDAHNGVYFRSESGGLLAGDGTEETESDPDDYETTADFDFLASTGDALRERLPVGDVGVLNSWAGLGTATPDGRPLVGRVPVRPGDETVSGLFVAAGTQAHGFMRAPTLGRAVSVSVLTDGPHSYPEYRPTRFDADPGDFAVEEMMSVEDNEA